MKTKSCFGVVAMLDALGAKNLSMEESHNFLKKVDDFIVSISKHTNFELEQVGVSTKPELSVFGDTIIYTWDLHESKYPNIQLLAVAQWLRPAIVSGLMHGILWRGALAMGDYLWSESVVLGPAVSDAASWCQEADWIGIIATPNCSQRISELNAFIQSDFYKQNNKEIIDISERYVKYPVPLRDGTIRQLYAINWPRQYTFVKEIKESNNKQLIKEAFEFPVDRMFFWQLQSFPIPKGTEIKFEHTEMFFNKCIHDLVK